MQIGIVGCGYVGLVSGACFADFGHKVICIDTDVRKIASLKHGEIPIYEPGLKELVHNNVAHGRLVFTTEMAAAVTDSDIVFIAVGTPSRALDSHADLSGVFAAARAIAPALTGFTVVATKSTVPVGTADELQHLISEVNPAADFTVASNPEFLREGAAITDFKLPNRIVVGIDDERARVPMSEVYRPLYINHAPVLFTSRRTAELIKYASNAFLAMKISFINEMADLCESLDADVQDLARGIGLDNRIGSKFLHAGPGYGGSCFPKDTSALVKIAQDHGCSVQLVETTVAINEKRKRGIARRILTACGGTVRGKRIAILGLTFKPKTDDMRDAPSLSIIQALKDKGARVCAYDPAGMENARALVTGIDFATDAYDAAEGADAVVIVTEWEEFRALDFERLKALMKRPTLVDLRNIYTPAEVMRQGFQYVGVGRSPAASTVAPEREALPVAS